MIKIPRIRLFNSVVKDKMPNPETSKIGEIYINANAERPFLSTKTSDGGMVKVIAEDEINTKIQAEATARQEADNAIKDSIKNIDLTSKADATALTEVSIAVKTKADNTALSKEIEDRKSEIARVEGKIPTDMLSADELTKDEKAIAAAFQEQKINIDALRLSIETLKKRISSLEKALKAKA